MAWEAMAVLNYDQSPYPSVTSVHIQDSGKLVLGFEGGLCCEESEEDSLLDVDVGPLAPGAASGTMALPRGIMAPSAAASTIPPPKLYTETNHYVG